MRRRWLLGIMLRCFTTRSRIDLLNGNPHQGHASHAGVPLLDTIVHSILSSTVLNPSSTIASSVCSLSTGRGRHVETSEVGRFHSPCWFSYSSTARQHSLCMVSSGQAESNRSVAILFPTQPSASIHVVPNVVDEDLPFCPLFPSGNFSSSAVFQTISPMDGSMCLCVLNMADVRGCPSLPDTDSAVINISQGECLR